MCDDVIQQELISLRNWRQEGKLDKISAWLVDRTDILESRNPALCAFLCMYHFLVNERELAQQLFERINTDDLKDTASSSDYALCCFVQGRSEAVSIIREVCSNEDADAIAWARLGTMLMASSELEDAEQAFKRSLDLQPNTPEVLSNLGGIRVRQSRYEEALTLYNRCLAQGKPQPVADRQRALVLVQLGNIDSLLDEKLEELERQPDQMELHKQLAAIQTQAARHTDALATLNAAVDRFTEDPGLKLQYAQLLLDRKHYQRAGLLLKQWLEDDEWMANLDESSQSSTRRSLRLMLNQGRIEVGFLDAAETGLDEMSEEEKRSPEYAGCLARLYEERNRVDEAVELLVTTIEQFPGYFPAVHQITGMLASLGRLDEAAKYSIQAAKDAPGMVVQMIENHGYVASTAETQSLRDLLASPQLPPISRASAGFTLHKVLEKQKSYEEAFECLITANDLMKSGLDYQWRNHRRLVMDLQAVFDEELIDRLQGKGLPSARPVFVVGMPRSGTTLTEQIIGSHPQAYGAGELSWIPRVTSLMARVVDNGDVYPQAMRVLTEHQLKSAAQYYLEKIALIDDEQDHIVDKLPHNFDHVGLIALAFPNAKIIHLDRNPRDVAVSNYQQNFGAWSGTMGFAFDLGWIGQMINDHSHIMSFWKERFPDRIYTLNYEGLVNDPETVTRELISFCDLPWDDRCLEFYANKSQVKTASIRQVRQKMYTTSAEKWRRYEAYLQPLEAALTEGYRALSESELRTDERGVTPLGMDARTE